MFDIKNILLIFKTSFFEFSIYLLYYYQKSYFTNKKYNNQKEMFYFLYNILNKENKGVNSIS